MELGYNMDLDMDMHSMRENLPEDECVQWKSSQTTNYALDSLMAEAQRMHQPPANQGGSKWDFPSTSRVEGSPMLFQPSATSAPPPPSRNRRLRVSHTPQQQQQNLSLGLGLNIDPEDPESFKRLLKDISMKVDENAAMAMRSSSFGGMENFSAAPARRGVKQRTMAIRRDRPASLVGTGKGKGKEREPMKRSSSFASTSSASPDSNYSFTSGDTSMTSPEPDDFKRTQDLMPPPPVPQNRLPLEIDTNRLGIAGSVVSPVRTQAQHHPQCVPVAPPRAAVSEMDTNRRSARDIPRSAVSSSVRTQAKHHPQPALVAAPRAGVSNPANNVQQQQRRPTHSNSQQFSTRPPETHLHPLLKQKTTTAPSTHTNPSPAIRANPPSKPPAPVPAPARNTPPMSQSQPQQRRAPPLGMRRTNTAPLATTPLATVASSSAALSSSQAARKFRTPFLNPNAIASSGTNAVAASSNGPVQPVVPASGIGGAAARTPVKVERDAQAQPHSSPSEGDLSYPEISFDFDPEELDLAGL
ncbi:hypothetical protein C8R43DRAFT_1228961 [Mycena crocata]|nr:hypothetical protein C8R43DRAFT_1228961 [Mycena crocata]